MLNKEDTIQQIEEYINICHQSTARYIYRHERNSIADLLESMKNVLEANDELQIQTIVLEDQVKLLKTQNEFCLAEKIQILQQNEELIRERDNLLKEQEDFKVERKSNI